MGRDSKSAPFVHAHILRLRHKLSVGVDGHSKWKYMTGRGIIPTSGRPYHPFRHEKGVKSGPVRHCRSRPAKSHVEIQSYRKRMHTKTQADGRPSAL